MEAKMMKYVWLYEITDYLLNPLDAVIKLNLIRDPYTPAPRELSGLGSSPYIERMVST